jgi:hypothetical protein
MARSWLAQPMRLLELGVAGPTGTTPAVDLRSGEHLTVDAPDVDTTVADGDAVLARVVPAEDVWLLTSAIVRIPPSGRERAIELLNDEVRPFQLLQLLVDLQVDALKLSRAG